MELLKSKKFLSALVSVVLIIIINLLFTENPETIKELQYIVMGLFGVQIAMQGGADFGKEKAKEERKKIEAEVTKIEFEASLAKAVSSIAMPASAPPDPGPTPWQGV